MTLRILLLLPALLFAQTNIYRSVQIDKTSTIQDGDGNNLTISSGTATFSVALPDTIGVGDAIQYDDDGDSDIDANDSICFIHARTSSTVFTVKNAAGSNPTDVANDQDWNIFRAYTSMVNTATRAENTGIDADLRDFDAGTVYNISSGGTNETWRFAMYRGEESVSGAIVGCPAWTTLNGGVGNFIIYYSPYLSSEVGTSQRHSGSLTALCYMLTRTDAGVVLGVNVSGTGVPDNVWFDGIQVRTTASGSTSGTFVIGARNALQAGAEIRVSNCIIKGMTNSNVNGYAGIGSDVAFNSYKIWNNIVYDIGGTQTRVYGIGTTTGATGTMYAYNNTVHNSKNSYFREAATIVLKNNISQSDATDGYNGTFDAASNYNLSERAADAPGANSKNSTTVTFTNEAGDIFLLDTADSGAKESGTDLSADANLSITTDILNANRSVPWDMGAHEVSSATRRFLVIE